MPLLSIKSTQSARRCCAFASKVRCVSRKGYQQTPTSVTSRINKTSSTLTTARAASTHPDAPVTQALAHAHLSRTNQHHKSRYLDDCDHSTASETRRPAAIRYDSCQALTSTTPVKRSWWRQYLWKQNTMRAPPKPYYSRMPSKVETFTLEQISKWSCKTADTKLPQISDIKAISIIDFDNTLFNSPLPNKDLWRGLNASHLQGQHFFQKGGWWHDNRILAATGEGIDKEEDKGWEGHWNEDIVKTTRVAMKDPSSLTVLLTGRGVERFSLLINRILDSRKLWFDMVVLKPATSPTTGRTFASTGVFKTEFLEELLHTYILTCSLRIYEDRAPHVTMFKQFGAQYNEAVCLPEIEEEDEIDHTDGKTRAYIEVDVIEVPAFSARLDPNVEAAAVQEMVLEHNAAGFETTHTIKKTIVYTGYLLSSETKQRLLSLFNIRKQNPKLKILTETVLIMPRACPKNILANIGGIGARVDFKVTAIGNWENSIWAVRVRAVDPDQKIYTDTRPAVIILGHEYQYRPHDVKKIKEWHAIAEDDPLGLQFTTTVGEKMFLEFEFTTTAQEGEGPRSHIPRNNRGSNFPYGGRPGYRRGGWSTRGQPSNRSAYSYAHRPRGADPSENI